VRSAQVGVDEAGAPRKSTDADRVGASIGVCILSPSEDAIENFALSLRKL